MRLEKFINIGWYMERKPYTVHSDADIFYLNICRKLFTIINNLADEYDDVIDIDEEDCRQLAYVFTAYFEDQVNDIGFWKSLTALHKKHFGKRLPFFDAAILNQYEKEYDDIMPVDIHYLAFIQYICLLSDEKEQALVFFNKPFFVDLTEQVFDYLNNIEEIVTNNFYEKYLIPAQDYIDFKKQIDWFCFYGYLTGPEFTRQLEHTLWKLENDDTDADFIGPMMYAETDRLLFEVPSLFTAFFPVDILAGAMRCNDKKKEEIINLKFRPHGIFHIQEETGTHYRMLHTATTEEFNVLISSFNNPINVVEQEYWITTLAKWNGDHYISGLCMPSPYKGEEIYHRNIELQHSFQKHFAPYRKEIEELALNYRNKAVEFFGSELIVFKTSRELQKRLNEFNQWYFDTVADKKKLAKNAKPVYFALPEELSGHKDISLFFPPKDGLQFLLKHKQLLNLLQAVHPEKVSPEEIQKVIPMLFDDSVGADYWFYLKKNFPIPNLSLFLKCNVDTKEDFEALLRIYRAADFSPLLLPRFSTFTSERIAAETVTQIFSKK
ncbi:MAG: DUF3843 family protein [Ginsengibacter sp.]